MAHLALCLHLTWLVATGAEPDPRPTLRPDAGVPTGAMSPFDFSGANRRAPLPTTGVVVFGSLSARPIEAQLEARRDTIERCVRAARSLDVGPVTLEFSFGVSRAGRVPKTTVRGVPTCLLPLLGELDFGAQEKPAQVSVTLRFGVEDAPGGTNSPR